MHLDSRLLNVKMYLHQELEEKLFSFTRDDFVSSYEFVRVNCKVIIINTRFKNQQNNIGNRTSLSSVGKLVLNE